MVFVEHHICKAWSKEADDFLNNFFTREDSKSLLIMDYAKELHVSESLFRTAMRNLHLTGEFRTGRNKELENEVKRLVAEDEAALQEAHPLVTDKKYLKMSCWPNTIPNCFGDLDEDIV